MFTTRPELRVSGAVNVGVQFEKDADRNEMKLFDKTIHEHDAALLKCQHIYLK